MLVNPELKAKAEARVWKVVEQVEQLYGVKFAHKLKILFDINSGRLAGQANMTECVVRFNPAYLNKYGDDYIEDTIPHEVCHIGEWEVYHTRGHGSLWKNMMRRVGAKPTRCHSYTPEAGQGHPKTKYLYKCSKCGSPVVAGPKIHANIQKGQKYNPKCCGRSASLILTVGNVGKVSYSEAKELATGQPSLIPTKPIDQPTYSIPPTNGPGTSKMDKCRAIYDSNKHLNPSRQEWIKMFKDQAGCTDAGASTYLQSIKSKNR
jgi:SprT protein